MARATARGISPAGEAFSTLMTGAAQVAGSYGTFKESGALGKKTTTDTAGRSTARHSNTPRHSNLGNFFGKGI